MIDNNSHEMGPANGEPDESAITLLRPVNREHGLAGVITRLVALQFLADLEKETTPTRMPPRDVVPYVKGWLTSGALVGQIRLDDGTFCEIDPDEWDDAKIESCINGHAIRARAGRSSAIVQAFGAVEHELAYDALAALAQHPGRNLPGDEMIALATVQGFTPQAETAFGRPFFMDRDIERVFGYGWELFTPAPSLDDPALSADKPAFKPVPSAASRFASEAVIPQIMAEDGPNTTYPSSMLNEVGGRVLSGQYGPVPQKKLAFARAIAVSIKDSFKQDVEQIMNSLRRNRHVEAMWTAHEAKGRRVAP